MSIRVEPLTPDRVDGALAVYRAGLGEPRHGSREEILDRMARGAGLFYVAVDTATGQVVGLKRVFD